MAKRKNTRRRKRTRRRAGLAAAVVIPPLVAAAAAATYRNLPSQRAARRRADWLDFMSHYHVGMVAANRQRINQAFGIPDSEHYTPRPYNNDTVPFTNALTGEVGWPGPG